MSDDVRSRLCREHILAASPKCKGAESLSNVGVAIHLTYDVLRQQMASLVAPDGLSKSTANMVLLLKNGPCEARKLHSLGELLLVGRANITGLVDNMEEKGLVKRL